MLMYGLLTCFSTVQRNSYMSNPFELFLKSWNPTFLKKFERNAHVWIAHLFLNRPA